MDRPFKSWPEQHPALTGASAAAKGAATPGHCLPPTRAARPARSRGVFFRGRRLSRLGQWIANGVCVTVVTLSLAASAHFAEPVFDAAAISGNAGPELLASATHTPAFLAAPAR